jgi:signal transduction histidine kinase
MRKSSGPTICRGSGPQNAPGDDLRVPPEEEAGSTSGAVPTWGSSATLAGILASKRSHLLIDAVLGVAIFAASIGLLAAGDSDLWDRAAGVQVLAILLTGLSSLPLMARRRWPLPVFVVTALASTALRAIAAPAGPPLGPTVALFGVASRSAGSRVSSRLTLAVVAALLAAHVAASGLADHSFPGAELLFAVVLWGGTWVAGDRARLRAERMAELEDRALRAEREAERERRLAAAEERMRIARDLHDSAGHAINVILVHAGAGRLQTERDPAAARAAFGTIEDVARETVGEIDQLVGALREDAASEVEPPPGVAALEGLVARHRAAGLEVTTNVIGEHQPLPPSVDRAAYRILQEALTNAARHGDGSARVDVRFASGALEIDVSNPPAHPGAVAGGGHGVIGMRERAALVGGSLQTEVHDGRFEVHARLPI